MASTTLGAMSRQALMPLRIDSSTSDRMTRSPRSPKSAFPAVAATNGSPAIRSMPSTRTSARLTST